MLEQAFRARVPRSSRHGIQITFVRSRSDQKIIYGITGLFDIAQLAIESRTPQAHPQ